MESFTRNSDEGMTALFAALPDHYTVGFSRTDMVRLLTLFWTVLDWDHVHSHPVEEGGDEDCLGCWADGFIALTAETLGIDFV